MIRGWLVLVLALPSFGQLLVSRFDGTAEQVLGGVTDLGTTNMGDCSEFRFHARNSTTAGIALQTLGLSGVGFAISSRPPNATIVAPGSFVEFRATFAPVATGSYSASLSVNGASWILRATATAAPILSDADGPAAILGAGTTIDFGRVQKKKSAVRTLQLENLTSTPMTVSSIQVSGTAFGGPAGITLPVKLDAGGKATFRISFDPPTAGTMNGSLAIDGRQFPLTGIAFDPPLPPPKITVRGQLTSAQQPVLAVTFDEIPESSGSGTITLDFHASVTVFTDDPGILFPTTGSRQLSFDVNEGDATASFGGLKSIPLQTGTTAGTLTLTVQLAGKSTQSSITIQPADVAIEKATSARRASDIDVTILGFDNTRSAGRFTFRFYDRAGALIAPGTVSVDATGDFSRYFAISRVGGSFLVRITFPVAGDATQVGAVQAECQNSVGPTALARMTLQ